MSTNDMHLNRTGSIQPKRGAEELCHSRSEVKEGTEKTKTTRTRRRIGSNGRASGPDAGGCGEVGFTASSCAGCADVIGHFSMIEDTASAERRNGQWLRRQMKQLLMSYCHRNQALCPKYLQCPIDV
jgi:hypothetical protein